MKSLLEFKSITEEEKKDYSKFDSLIRAGLANKAQIQRIHRIMDKMGEDRPVFNNADREIMRNLFNKMADLISNNKQIYTQARRAVKENVVKSNMIVEEPLRLNLKDPPFVLVLKREAIRVYPDGTKIALYYNHLLDKHFSIPYGPGIDAPLQAEEMSVLESLKHIVEHGECQEVWFETDSRSVEPETAKDILKLYNSLSEENKIKMEQNLNDSEMFDKFHEFSLKIE